MHSTQDVCLSAVRRITARISEHLSMGVTRITRQRDVTAAAAGRP